MSAPEFSSVPKRFSAYIGGFTGASYSLELRDEALAYTVSESGAQNSSLKLITPTPAQWREFRQILDDINVWQWHSGYRSDGVVDGTQWSLDIAYADHAVKTHGDNNYPYITGKPNGQPYPTQAFNRYLAAIKKLTGGKIFE